MTQDFHISFMVKYAFSVFLIWCTSLVFGWWQFTSPIVILAVALPICYYFAGKIIKYKISKEEIVVLAFQRFVLARFSINDIARVDDVNAFFTNPITTFRQGHTRKRMLRNSYIEKGKLIKLKNGQTVVISPERGSEVDLFLLTFGEQH